MGIRSEISLGADRSGMWLQIQDFVQSGDVAAHGGAHGKLVTSLHQNKGHRSNN